MLRITVEILPHGDETTKRVVANGKIWQECSIDHVATYRSSFTETPWQGVVRGPYESEISDWLRLKNGLWQLVHAMLGESLKSEPSPETFVQSVPTGTGK